MSYLVGYQHYLNLVHPNYTLSSAVSGITTTWTLKDGDVEIIKASERKNKKCWAIDNIVRFLKNPSFFDNITHTTAERNALPASTTINQKTGATEPWPYLKSRYSIFNSDTNSIDMWMIDSPEAETYSWVANV